MIIYGPYTFPTQGDVSNDDWTFIAPGGNGLQARGTNRRWCFSDTSTPSTGVGPDIGRDSDGFVYTEATSPTAAGDVFIMEFNTALDNTAATWEVIFNWCTRGNSATAEVFLDTNTDGAGWVPVLTTGGFTEGTNGTTIWNQWTVPLADSGTSTLVRIRVVMPSSGTIWHNDVGIDSITITGTPKGPPPDPTITDVQPTSSPEGSQITVTGTNFWSQDAQDLVVLADFAAELAVAQSNILLWTDTQIIFESDLGGEPLGDNWTVVVVKDSGGANERSAVAASPIEITEPLPAMVGTYTFDSYSESAAYPFTYSTTQGTGLRDTGGGNGYWMFDTNATASNGPGPPSGQGGNPDGYVYTEASDPGFTEATITSEVMDGSSFSYTVSFYEYAGFNGTSDGTWYFEVWDGAGWQIEVQETGEDLQWELHSVDLSAYTNADLQFRWRFVRGADTTWHYDWALDTVTVTAQSRVSYKEGAATLSNSQIFNANGRKARYQDASATLTHGQALTGNLQEKGIVEASITFSGGQDLTVDGIRLKDGSATVGGSQIMTPSAVGGAPQPIPLTFDHLIGNDPLLDLSLAEANNTLRSAYAFEYEQRPFASLPGSGLALNSGPINAVPINAVDLGLCTPDMLWSLDLNYRYRENQWTLGLQYEIRGTIAGSLELAYSVTPSGSQPPVEAEFELLMQWSVFTNHEGWVPEFLAILNEARRNFGLFDDIRPYDGVGPNIAEIHNKNMIRERIWAHEDPSFGVPWVTITSRGAELGYPFPQNISENLAWRSAKYSDSFYLPTDLYQDWFNSPGHYANMFRESMDEDSTPKLLIHWNRSRNGSTNLNLPDGGYSGANHYWYVTSVYLWNFEDYPLGTEMNEFSLELEYAVQGGLIEVVDVLYSVTDAKPVRVQHDSQFGLVVSAQHEIQWQQRVSVQHEMPITYSVQVAHEALYTDAGEPVVSHSMVWSILDYIPVAQQHETPIGYTITTQHESRFSFLAAASAQHEARYGILDYTLVAQQHEAPITFTLGTAHDTPYGYLQASAAQHESRYGILDYTLVAQQHETPIGYTLTAAHEAQFGYLQAATAQHEGRYGILDYTPVAQQHEAPVSYTLTTSFDTPYGYLTLVTNQHDAQWGILNYSLIGQQHEAQYGVNLSSQHQADFSVYTTVQAQHDSQYGDAVDVQRQHESRFELLGLNRVRAQSSALYSMSDTLLINDDASTYIQVGANRIDVQEVMVSKVETDFAWTATVRMADMAGYRLLTRGVMLDLVILDETYKLMVESKSISRQGGKSSLDLKVECVSPKVVLGLPYASLMDYQNPAGYASDIVADILGEPVTWEALDWFIPEGRVAGVEADPLSLAKSVAEAIGAVLDSNKDGTIRVRPLYKATIPEYSTTSIDHVFTDEQDNLSSSEVYEMRPGYDRFRVTQSKSVFNDRMEFEEDEEAPGTGILYAYPSPWRTGVRVRSTSSLIYSTIPLGQASREVTELVEFVKGVGQVKYPVDSLQSVEWRSTVLGGVGFTQFSTDLTTDTAVNEGYGLALITYTVRSLNYEISGPLGTAAQFVLEDL